MNTVNVILINNCMPNLNLDQLKIHDQKACIGLNMPTWNKYK